MNKKIMLIAYSFLSFLQIQTSLEIYCGSMCSGKSREFRNKVTTLQIGRKKVFVAKPSLDNRALDETESRDPRTYIASRDGTTITCIPINFASELLEAVSAQGADYIAIDEAQFLNKEYLPIMIAFINSGKHLILAGLDTDFRGEPFGQMPYFLSIADEVHKLKAVCSVCHEYTYCLTQRLIDGKPAKYNDPIIMVGDQQYEPRCRKCHTCPKE
jgi:thymidine kinase